MSEQTRPTVRMRVTIEGYYDAPLDPNVYEGTTDPHEMARIDAQNPLDAILGLMGEPQVRIEPAPIPACQQAEGVVFNVLFAKRIARCTVTAGVALGWAREVVAALDREGLLVTVVPGEDLEAAYEAGWREAVTGIVDRLRGEAEGRRLMWLGAELSPPPEAQIRELHMAADLIEREFGADEEDGDD